MHHDLYFHEEQHFDRRLLLAVALIPLIMFVVLLLSPQTQPAALLVFIPVAALLIFVGAYMKLITEVGPDGIAVRLRPFPTFRYAFSRLQSVQPRKYRPILEYGGWGIRWSARGWAYNARGNEGVQLVLDDGGRVLIGSQEAERLAEAIEYGRRQAVPRG